MQELLRQIHIASEPQLMMMPDSRHEDGETAYDDVERASRPSVPWWQGWALLVLLPGGVLLFAPPGWPAWVVMWSLALRSTADANG